jgi:hypothetical protein
VNPNTRTKEFSLRDPDGYYVTISALPLERAAVAKPQLKRPKPTKTRGNARRLVANRPRRRG